MDITIVSFLPNTIEETKPGLLNGVFKIPGVDEKGLPGVLHINNARSNLYIRDGKTFPITHPSDQVADAIVNDFCTAQMEASDEDKPALFWVEGKLNKFEVVQKHKDKCEKAKASQNRWFAKLVRRADDDFTRTKLYRMVTDLQRNAAKSLGLINKPWYHEPQPVEMTKCPFCSTMVEAAAAICFNCKNVVNIAKAKELGLGSVTT